MAVKKNLTKRDFVRLIKQISRATKSGPHSEHFVALLSAMRGPDDANMTLKSATTTVIRNRLDWHCGQMTDSGETLDQVSMYVSVEGPAGFSRPKILVANSTHFSLHIRQALHALEYFGFNKVRRGH